MKTAKKTRSITLAYPIWAWLEQRANVLGVSVSDMIAILVSEKQEQRKDANAPS